ncbi:hypothetical protein FXO38_18249 [Capsicum annuum]|nr:hypothetical protein FXO37_36114 [Capsicum annuum]KAF3648287.1 hypothetical protein FXO38_18249 [Capsicum annuum]
MEGVPFKYKENNTKIMHLYLTPTVCKIEQRYIKIFKPYTDEVKYTSIDVLKLADEDKDLGGHNYISSPARACDHASSSGLKTTPDSSNDDDLRERVALLEKSILDIASFIRDERLRRIEKNKKKQQDEEKEEEIKEEKAANEQDVKEEEEKEKDEEMTAEEKQKIENDGEKKFEEEKNEKAVDEEGVAGQKDKSIEEEKKLEE